MTVGQMDVAPPRVGRQHPALGSTTVQSEPPPGCHCCVSSGKTERDSRPEDALKAAEVEQVHVAVGVKVERVAPGLVGSAVRTCHARRPT